MCEREPTDFFFVGGGDLLKPKKDGLGGGGLLAAVLLDRCVVLLDLAVADLDFLGLLAVP